MIDPVGINCRHVFFSFFTSVLTFSRACALAVDVNKKKQTGTNRNRSHFIILYLPGSSSLTTADRM